MGATFSYVTVFAGMSFPDRARLDVINAVRASVLSGPYSEVGSRLEADRSVGVARLSAAPWVHVADDRDLRWSDKSLFDRARLLSIDTGHPVVSVSVFDSDDISMILWVDGVRVDTFARTPPGGALPFGMSESEAGGDPLAWRALLAVDHRPDELRACWQTPRDVVDDIVQDAADLFGWDSRYWAGRSSDMARFPDEGDTWLHFAFLEPHPRLTGAPLLQANTVFARFSGGGVGDHLTIQFPIATRGGPVEGIAVRWFGPALSEGTILPTFVSVEGAETCGSFELRRIQPGGPIWVAQCATVSLPGALSEEHDDDPDFSYSLSIARRKSRSSVNVTVAGQVQRPGPVEFALVIEPCNGPVGRSLMWGCVEIAGLEAHPRQFLTAYGEAPKWLQNWNTGSP